MKSSPKLNSYHGRHFLTDVCSGHSFDCLFCMRSACVRFTYGFNMTLRKLSSTKLFINLFALVSSYSALPAITFIYEVKTKRSVMGNVEPFSLFPIFDADLFKNPYGWLNSLRQKLFDPLCFSTRLGKRVRGEVLYVPPLNVLCFSNVPNQSAIWAG